MPERIRTILARARAATQAGDDAAAARSYQQAAEVARAADLPGELAYCLRHGAQSSLEAGELDAALTAARDAAEIYDRTEASRGLNYANTARLIALAHERMGEGDKARPLWSEARRIYNHNGVGEAVDECDAHLGLAP